ncbi:E3 ubiquitin-protein ligase hrd1 [Ceratocystis pirilliformis]|uniref:RING-type E3 ubiquitin transferase n=1 Tax=Ceratocystis pirilliformis TaxID=259994 RepID=A0ABR3YKQ4_9PEZI
MRLAAYITGSAVLALGVSVSAFQMQANFYSAMVYLSQSNFCLLVLVNFIFIIYASIMHGLRHLCFGPLRTAEVEQLSDRAWIAITETCLAMTIFREEIGAYFLTMFTALVTGKVWAWIGEGRVETYEQQPPANPRLFHTRLVISLAISMLYDLALFKYAAGVVIEQVRPTMMIMFLFEFAVLTTTTSHTIVRYMFNILESFVVKSQTKKRLEERRNEVRLERERLIKERKERPPAEGDVVDDLPDPDDIEEMDIEVPGWEEKGQYMLTMDLIADFLKLAIYVAFFFMLFSFYGLPVHILRDIYITGASFFRRVAAMLKYRRAIQNMTQYADANAQDLAREDTCIICRDVMRPWDPRASGAIERTRPKKLPCGHILHFGCLKSWLERQQVCPTCRRPVSNNAPQNNNNGPGLGPMAGGNAAPQNAAPADVNVNGIPPQQQPGPQPRAAQPANPALGVGVGPAGEPDGLREYQFGPLRLRVGVRQFLGDQALQQAQAAQQAFLNNGNLPPNNIFNNNFAPNNGLNNPAANNNLPFGNVHQNPPPAPAPAPATTTATATAATTAAHTPAQHTPNATLPHTPITGVPYHPHISAGPPPMPQIPPNGDLTALRAHVREINEIMSAHVASLQSVQQEIHLNNLLMAEITRLQATTNSPQPTAATPAAASTAASTSTSGPNQYTLGNPNPLANSSANSFQSLLTPNRPFTPPPGVPLAATSAGLSRQRSTSPLRTAIPSGSSDLPSGLVLPHGWSLVPINKPEQNQTAPPAATNAINSTTTSAPPSVRSVSRSRSPVRSRTMRAALQQSSSFNNLYNASAESAAGPTTSSASPLDSMAGTIRSVPVVAPSPLSASATSSLLEQRPLPSSGDSASNAQNNQDCRSSKGDGGKHSEEAFVPVECESKVATVVDEDEVAR